MKLLLVDDNKNFTKLLKLSLESKHYNIDTADNGNSALNKMRRTVFDWVISDINMGVLNGIELSRKIRSEYPQTKIILMTAFETPEKIAELDIEAFLEKPVHAEDLLKIINNNK
jgi:DNA-binding response OmpR family regulator